MACFSTLLCLYKDCRYSTLFEESFHLVKVIVEVFLVLDHKIYLGTLSRTTAFVSLVRMSADGCCFLKPFLIMIKVKSSIGCSQ